MELWVRSQDKEKLLKVDEIHLGLDKEYKLNVIWVNNWIVGEYKSKERALEVLDEIQNILNLKDMYKYDRELVLKSWKNVDKEQVKTVRQQMSVYEIPKD